MKRLLFILFLAVIAIPSRAQTGFGIGYNAGFYTRPLYNLDILLYEHNKAHPNYTDHFRLPNLTRGLCFAFRVEDDSWGYEAMWANRHMTTDARGADSIGGIEWKHRVKARLNTLNNAVYFKDDEGVFKAGMSIDFSVFKMLKKVAPVEDYGSAKYEKIFDKKGIFSMAFTFFLDAGMPGTGVRIRPYYQAAVLPVTMPYTPSIFGATQFKFKLSNWGVMAMFNIGKK